MSHRERYIQPTEAALGDISANILPVEGSQTSYDNAYDYMRDLRAAIIENDIKAMAHSSYGEHLAPLLETAQVQTARDIALFWPRVSTHTSPGDIASKTKSDIEALELAAQLYVRHVPKLLSQLGGAALTLRNKYNMPSFATIFDDTELRDKVIRYMQRNHRRLVWELADHNLENLNATELGCTFSLYHPAEEVDRLRKEYTILGESIVDFTIVNSPRKTHDVLDSIRREYVKLIKISRFKALGNGTIKAIVTHNPSAPKQAVEGALTAFQNATADVRNNIFTEGDIRYIMGKSHETLDAKLQRARGKVNELAGIEKYTVLGERFIARHVLKRPINLKTYLDEVVRQLDSFAGIPRFSRFETSDILLLIESNPADGHAIMQHAATALEAIEADPECREFGVFYVTPLLLRDAQPYKKFKTIIARYKRMRVMPKYATLQDSELKKRVF